jgi:D-3-phosphoglycerate dehydrogenase
MAILMNHKISLTPIGAATGEAQDRIGTELAHKLLVFWANVLKK